jgi:hypothetical protein
MNDRLSTDILRRLLKRWIGRFQRDGILPGAHILGKSASAGCTGQVPENLIAWLILPDVSANRDNPPGEIRSKYLVFWPQKSSRHQADKERICPQESPVPRIDGCCMDSDQYFIIPGSGVCHLLELQDIR